MLDVLLRYVDETVMSVNFDLEIDFGKKSGVPSLGALNFRVHKFSRLIIRKKSLVKYAITHFSQNFATINPPQKYDVANSQKNRFRKNDP